MSIATVIDRAAPRNPKKSNGRSTRADARLSVHHLLLTRLCRSEPTVPRWSLVGVDYLIVIPPELELPRVQPQLDLFVRFVVRRAGYARIRLRVEWEDVRADLKRHSVYFHERRFETSGVYVDDKIRLTGVYLPGAGRYRIVLHQRIRRRGLKPIWRSLKYEYFFVEKLR